MSSGSSGVGDTQYFHLTEPPTTGPLAEHFQPGGAFYPLPSFPMLVVTQTLDPSSQLSGPNLPIIVYSQAVIEAIDGLREQLYASEAAESEASKKFFKMLLQRAGNLRELTVQVNSAVRMQEGVSLKRDAEINNINIIISNYNTTVSGPPPTENSAIDELNQAILNYYDTEHPDYLDDAVLQAAYQDYASYAALQNVTINQLNDEIAAYNAQVAINNAQIEIINVTRVMLGSPPFELQEPLPLRPLMPNLPPFPPASGTALGSRSNMQSADVLINPPGTDYAYYDAYVALYENNLIFIRNFSDELKKSNIDQNYYTSRHRGKAILARLGPEPIAPAEAETPSSSPSSGYASTALGVFKTLDLIFSQAMWDAAMKGEAIFPTQRTLDEIRATTLSLIQGASLNAAGPTLAFLAQSLPSVSLLPYIGIDEAAVAVVFSLSYANQIRLLINGEILHETVLQGFRQDPAFGNLSQDKISNMAATFAAGIGVSLGLLSMQHISKALGTPGLSAQLLSLLPGIQALGSNVLSPPVFSELVGNGFTSALVGSMLIGAGLDRSEASVVMQKALSNAGEGPNGYFSALTKALEESGFDTTSARNLAFNTTLEVLGLLDQENVTEQQLSQPLLPGSIGEEALTQALQDKVAEASSIAKEAAKDLEERRYIENSILKQTIKEDFRYQQELTRSQIKANLLAENVIKDSIMRDFLTNEIIRKDINLVMIRSAIARAASNAGYDIASSASIASGAINSINGEQLQLALLDQNLLKGSLEALFMAQGLAESDAIANSNAIFHEKWKPPTQTIVNFRAWIAELLTHDFRVDPSSAGRLVAGLNIGAGGSGSLGLFNVGGPYMPQASIGDALRDHVVGLVSGSLGGDRANALASRINEDIISAHDSLLNLIQKSLGILEEKRNEEINELLRGNVKNAIRPTRDLYAFIDQINDPGNALIYSFWTGLMYSNLKPDDKKSVEIQP